MRCCFLAMCIFMIIMMVLMAGGSDVLGHLGGAIFGFLFGMAFYQRPRDETGKKTRMFGLGSFTLTAILMIALLFGLHQQHEQ